MSYLPEPSKAAQKRRADLEDYESTQSGYETDSQSIVSIPIFTRVGSDVSMYDQSATETENLQEE
ncbi:hypothetical protein VTP01DRAFT_3652 [Rhizomucor pusillus]|uniref:uncharacterized protein n=1 Tax=Rhizomucor pusillus TaxID=4840 RepID=UPI0037440B5C